MTLFLTLIPDAAAIAGPDEDYGGQLITQAREQGLSSRRYWDILLHYKPSRGGRTSLVDDPKFFLDPHGKTDPQAELEATLRGFFREPQLGDEHPRCRFAGRYAWIKEELAIDETRLPEVRCRKLEDAMTLMDPRSAVLIFPATHNNSPASMFGHTLIRIDNAAKSDLLSFAVNYAAVPDDANNFLYAVKGIFGAYPGYFSVLPYYEKVKEYNAIEHRDMWEYRLNLSREEARRMVLHTWEMQNISSEYYFFDENCSYVLLFLIEAARPSVRLADAVGNGVRFWVIPTDTIRAVRQNGLIEDVRYRPSQATKISSISGHLAGDHREQARQIGLGKIDPGSVVTQEMTPGDRMRVLDLAAEYIQYRASRREIEKDDYLKLFLPVLQVRSTLGQPSEELYSMPAPVRPDDGHLPGRFSIGGGCRTGSCFGEVAWRAAYHELMDDDDGFTEGSQITFFQMTGRYYDDEARLRLQSFRAIDIISLAPWNRFFKPLSWKVGTGIEQRTLQGGRERLAAFVNGGAGLSSQVGTGIAYVTADGELDAGSAYEDHYALSAGGSAGFLANLTQWWKLHLSARGLVPLAGDPYRTMKGEAIQNFTVGVNNSIAVAASREKTSGQYRTEVTAAWNLYY